MFLTIFIGLLLLAALVIFVISRRTRQDLPSRDEDRFQRRDSFGDRESRFDESAYERALVEYRPSAYGRALHWIAVGIFAFAGILLLFATIKFVPDEHVGVTRAFGVYSKTTRAPGVNLIWPWESMVLVDGRIKAYTFSSDEGSIDGPIQAQASGGGNLTIELTVQAIVTKETADNLIRTIGTNWFEVIVLPPIRSCTRDAPVNLTLEDAYTTKRTALGTNTFDCLVDKVTPHGITIIDVLIRDVDPGLAVRTAIDEKQSAEQQLQRASITLLEEEVKARQEAVRAYGISQAEQIVACGGVQTIDAEGNSVIVPNASCEDQFSAEYLQWLYINALSEISGVVILPPEFNGNLFVQTPSTP
ncbi:prohibitin family protein [Patescibacteria group bacterium]|nr:prohibitin family protein [Patescibacteria group bacterium]